MVFHRALLPGVYLTAVQSEKFKASCLSLNLVRPLCRAESTMNALLPSVLLRGTERYPDMQAISAFLDERYGATVGTLVRKKGEVQTTGFYLEFLDDALTPDGERMAAPMIAFLGELRNQRNTLAARITDKRGYAMTQMIRAMCRDEAYALLRLGEEDMLGGITPARLYNHYRSILATSRVEVFYMGRLPAEEIAGLLCGALADLPRGGLTQVKTRVVSAPGAPRTAVERLDVSQGKLCMGFRTGGITLHSPAYPALMLLNTIFGAGVNDKLFVHVREKLALCYYAGAALEKNKGVMLVSSGMAFENMDRARDEILRQLDLCRAGEITEEEISGAQRYLRAAFRSSQDSPGTLDDFYIGQALAGVDTTIEQLADAVCGVTRAQLVACANAIRLDTVYYLKGVEA